MIYFLLVSLLVVNCIWVSFFLWRTLRIDYVESKVLIFSFMWMVAVLVAGRLGYLAGIPIWSGLLAGGVVSVLFSRRFRWDLAEVWDLTILSSWGFGVWLFVLLHDWLYVVLCIVLMLVLFVLKQTYRKWRWYKSGKNGLVGCMGVIFWSLLIIWHDFWQMNVNIWIGAVLIGISVVAILLRSKVLLPKS